MKKFLWMQFSLFMVLTAMIFGANNNTEEHFILGVNVGGDAVNIDGNQWISDVQAIEKGLTYVNPKYKTTTEVTPYPSVDTETNTMLNSVRWNNHDWGIQKAIANGTYTVAIWIMENYKDDFRSINISIENQTKKNIGKFKKGKWKKYTFNNVKVNDGILDIKLQHNQGSKDVGIMGFAVFSQGSTGADTTSPVITLKGENPQVITVGTSYQELGATATDNVDGNITADIIIDNQVISSVSGKYTVSYEVFDDAGNKASVLRTVHVKERDDLPVNNKHVNILTIGDSFTDGADYLIPLIEKLKNSKHQNITFVGTKSDQKISHEGRAGWDAMGYMNLNPKWYPDSPFLNNNTIDFPNYFQNKLRVQPDIVIIQLGVNDVLSATKGVIKGYYQKESVIKQKIEHLASLLQGIKDSLPQAKILMMMPTEQNENDDTNINAETIGITNKDLYRELMDEYQEQYLDKFNSREKEGIYILKTYEYLDTKHDFRDFVHPNTEGFDKISKALHDKILHMISNGDTPEEVPTLGKKIFEIDFNKHPTGIYTKAMHRKDFYTYNGENLYYKNHDGTWMFGSSGPGETLSIVKDGNEKVLRVLYKKNKFSLGTYPNSETYTGFASFAALPKKNRPKEDINNPQEVTLIYYVKFESNFEWKIGGKLPGLAGGVAPGGGQRLGNHKMQNGFSARFMWHILKTSSAEKVPGLIGYIYHPGRTGEIGQFIYGAGSYMSTIKPTRSFTDRDNTNLFVFEREKWYKIKQTIKANTPYKSDGIMKVWINDKLATSYGNMKYIADGKHGEYAVDRLLFATFYGGGTQEYAPSRDTYTRFKNIQVYVK